MDLKPKRGNRCYNQSCMCYLPPLHADSAIRSSQLSTKTSEFP